MLSVRVVDTHALWTQSRDLWLLMERRLASTVLSDLANAVRPLPSLTAFPAALCVQIRTRPLRIYSYYQPSANENDTGATPSPSAIHENK